MVGVIALPVSLASSAAMARRLTLCISANMPANISASARMNSAHALSIISITRSVHNSRAVRGVVRQRMALYLFVSASRRMHMVLALWAEHGDGTFLEFCRWPP